MSNTSALIGTELKTHPGGYWTSTSWNRMQAADDATMTIFQCEEDCNLTGAMARCRFVTGTSPYYKFELFALDTSAYFTPTGSALATTAGFQAVHNGDCTHNFTSPYTCTAGQTLCLKLSHASGTIDGSNWADFLYYTATMKFQLMPMTAYWGGSSWIANNQYYPSQVVHTNLATGADFGGIYNIAAGGYESLGSTGDRYAQRMQIPASENLELHIQGFRYHGRAENSGGGDIIVGIWNAAGVALSTQTIDTHHQNYQAGQSYARDYYFGDTVTVASGEVVYLGFERNGGGQINVQYSKPNGLLGLKSWPGGDAFYASEWDGSSWTDDNTRRLHLNPILSSVHGLYEEAEECPPAVQGRGDRGHVPPSRVKNPRKPGYKVNLGKSIKRTNAAYGWNPYA